MNKMLDRCSKLLYNLSQIPSRKQDTFKELTEKNLVKWLFTEMLSAFGETE